MESKEYSMIRIIGLILSSISTILLKTWLPKNKVILLPKWNNKKTHKKIPDIAICIFFPMEENKKRILTKKEYHHQKMRDLKHLLLEDFPYQFLLYYCLSFQALPAYCFLQTLMDSGILQWLML